MGVYILALIYWLICFKDNQDKNIYKNKSWEVNTVLRFFE